MRVLIESQISEFIRPCLVSSGYGGSFPSFVFFVLFFCFFFVSYFWLLLDTFSGVECRKQEDCEFLDTTCDLMKGMCRAKPTSEIRDIYFECFFENMPPLVEVCRQYFLVFIEFILPNSYHLILGLYSYQGSQPY